MIFYCSDAKSIRPLKIALRSILRYKYFSIINLCGLSIVFSVVFVIALYTYNELNMDSFHKNIDNIMAVNGTTPHPLASSIKKQIPGVNQTLRIRPDYGEMYIAKFNDNYFATAGKWMV